MSRRQARDIAFKVLFEVDVGKNNLDITVQRALAQAQISKKDLAFVQELVQGVQENRESIDRLIEKYLVNWSFERLANVDRSILRLAVFEMLYRPDIPPVTSIDEAVELARTYQGEKSAAFVNGLLDRVMHECCKFKE